MPKIQMPDFTIICAIEAGRLEAQTLLMLRTLKRFGGPLATCPVIAFQGRAGEKISAATRRQLAALDTEYVFDTRFNQTPWFNYTNKIAAVLYAEAHAATPWHIWLDSDILILAPPGFAGKDTLQDLDFCARFEFLPPALAVGETKFAAYWKRVCAVCDVRFDEIGDYDLDMPAKRMKPFFNSGVFLWRKGTGFARTYADMFYRLLAARIAPGTIGPWFADQVALTPAISALDLRWRMLPAEDHLMLFEHALDNDAFLNVLPKANLVHYSKARSPAYRTRFDALVAPGHRDLAGILSAADTYDGQSTPHGINRLRVYVRRLRQKMYAYRCTQL
ncbi:MAG: hypothetical protein V2I76_03195 [Roseobacter sp.]|nr:hypothetical protein [Roseobacter sp.]